MKKLLLVLYEIIHAASGEADRLERAMEARASAPVLRLLPGGRASTQRGEDGSDSSGTIAEAVEDRLKVVVGDAGDGEGN